MLMYYDVLLVGALLCGLFGIYAVSRWLSHEYKLQAIADEINNLPLVDPYMEPAARFTYESRSPDGDGHASGSSARSGQTPLPAAGGHDNREAGLEPADSHSFNAPISLGAFQQHAPLRLVGGDDLTHAYRFSKRIH